MAEVSATTKKLEHELTYMIRRLEANARARNYPLERAHYLLLLRLDEDGPQSVGGLAQALSLDGSTVPRQVAAMERRGLVEKHPNPEDGRGALVAATETGREAAKSMQAARWRRLGIIFSSWSEEDRRSFTALLARANAALAEHAALD